MLANVSETAQEEADLRRGHKYDLHYTSPPAADFVRRVDFPPAAAAFDSAFDQ